MWCIRNKIQGALSLHETLPEDIDFLVLVSSLSPIMGSSTQANCAAGDSFLDGSVLHRHSHGLKARVLNDGFITGIGYVAERIRLDTAASQEFNLTAILPPGVWSTMESAMTYYLYRDKDNPTPAQILTCNGCGGLGRQLKQMRTHAHTAHPKYRYLNHLDARGDETSESAMRRNGKEFPKRLEDADSLNDAIDVVEADLGEKVASAIPRHQKISTLQNRLQPTLSIRLLPTKFAIGRTIFLRAAS